MAMRLSQVRAKISTATVEWEDETVDVGFFPAVMSPALLEQVQAAAKAENLDVVSVMLEPLLAWWDVLDDQDERLPTDPETIKTMPLAFLLRVLSAIQVAMRPPTQGA